MKTEMSRRRFLTASTIAGAALLGVLFWREKIRRCLASPAKRSECRRRACRRLSNRMWSLSAVAQAVSVLPFVQRAWVRVWS